MENQQTTTTVKEEQQSSSNEIHIFDEEKVMNELEKAIYLIRDIETGDAFIQRLEDWRTALDDLRGDVFAKASQEINECFEEYAGEREHIGQEESEKEEVLEQEEEEEEELEEEEVATK